mgnify:CR=1 FL=1
MEGRESLSRLEDLTLLSQCPETVDMFNHEYDRLLSELMEEMKGMKALAMIQAAWLKARAQNQEGPVQ